MFMFLPKMKNARMNSFITENNVKLSVKFRINGIFLWSHNYFRHCDDDVDENGLCGGREETKRRKLHKDLWPISIKRFLFSHSVHYSSSFRLTQRWQLKFNFSKWCFVCTLPFNFNCNSGAWTVIIHLCHWHLLEPLSAVCVPIIYASDHGN
jgi:hypothetical protein